MPVYTDGGKLHYFCEGRGGGGERGGLAEFTEVVYKLKEGTAVENIGSERFQCTTHYQSQPPTPPLTPLNTSAGT